MHVKLLEKLLHLPALDFLAEKGNLPIGILHIIVGAETASIRLILNAKLKARDVLRTELAVAKLHAGGAGRGAGFDHFWVSDPISTLAVKEASERIGISIIICRAV